MRFGHREKEWSHPWRRQETQWRSKGRQALEKQKGRNRILSLCYVFTQAKPTVKNGSLSFFGEQKMALHLTHWFSHRSGGPLQTLTPLKYSIATITLLILSGNAISFSIVFFLAFFILVFPFLSFLDDGYWFICFKFFACLYFLTSSLYNFFSYSPPLVFPFSFFK